MEARFELRSYGFQPGRGCHDAIGSLPFTGGNSLTSADTYFSRLQLWLSPGKARPQQPERLPH